MKKLIAVVAVAALALILLPADASAQIYVKNGGFLGIGDFETTDPTLPLHLKQPGNPAFLFESTTQAVRFNFKIGGTGLFTISKVGSTGAELLLGPAGGAATLRIDGGITADAFNVASSRDFKEGFEELSPSGVLASIATLPISRWQYKGDPSATRHIGPMAEDFYAAFGGATDKSISVSDAAGVALAAIQGLHQQAQQKDQVIAELLSRIEKLEQRLSDR